MEISETTILLQNFCLGFIITTYILQVFVFTAMVVVMKFEWILSLFFSIVFLAFPSIELQVIFNQNLQQNILTQESVWSIWFMLLFQLAALVVILELTMGDFSDYFALPSEFWSEFVLILQAVTYSAEIALFMSFMLSLGFDYGLILGGIE